MVATMNECADVRAGQAITPSWLRAQVAESQTLAEAGRGNESQACARAALMTFEESALPTAWYWQELADLADLAGPDILAIEMLIPRARGTLWLRSKDEVLEWFAFQKRIFDEIVAIGALDTAVEHVAGVVDTLPAPPLDDEWWHIVMKRFGYTMTDAMRGLSNDAAIRAFERAERAADAAAA